MHRSLQRQLGVWSAVLLGLGSIIGTGVFVSIGIAAGIAGPAVIWAVPVAGLIAVANGLSSAQLAAAHPVSGGTYVYAGRLISRRWGFVAGWTFLCAKSASAATAALGFAGYVIVALDLSESLQRPLAVGLVVAVGAVVLGGIRSSTTVNTVLVSVVLIGLVVFVIGGLPDITLDNLGAATDGAFGWLEATALMFVAYTGYGRIATLGEEVRNPVRTIPRAIIATMAVTIVLYTAVAVVAVGTVGAGTLAAATRAAGAPLATAAQSFSSNIEPIVELVAIVAMASVLLNLVLGLSRVMLAMGRGNDLPARLAEVNERQTTPVPATVVTLLVIVGLTLIGDVRTTWTFSAVTVLIYYTLTNAAALRLDTDQRRFPRWVSAAGMVACLGLAVFVDPQMWLIALALLAIGFAIRTGVARGTT